jgi:hypothetical protein
MKGKWIVFVLIIGLLATGCAAGESSQAWDVAPDMDLDYAYNESPPASGGSSDGRFNYGDEYGYQQTAIQEQLIIRTGNMSVVVMDTEASMAALTALVNERGGWIVTSSLYQSGQAKAGTITVRIPAAEFDNLMTAVRELSIEVTRETAEGQNVTEEYVDLSARLQNLQATADRVRSFLDEAETVEDALNVNRELSRLEGEIEAMTGRLQYLSQSAAYSTLTVNMTPDALAQPFEVAGWRPQGIARDAAQALVAAMQGLASILIWLGVFFLPLALVVLLPFGLITWAFLRWRRRRSL